MVKKGIVVLHFPFNKLGNVFSRYANEQDICLPYRKLLRNQQLVHSKAAKMKLDFNFFVTGNGTTYSIYSYFTKK